MKYIKSIGILGSGQLGRMISNAASKFGIKSHIYAPDAYNSPASQVSHEFTNAPYENTEELKNFVNSVDVVTCEFENVPFQTAEFLSKIKNFSPGISALKISQNRILEKQLAQSLNIPIPKYWIVNNKEDLTNAKSNLIGKGILKTTTEGYDGKGQVQIDKDTDLNLLLKNFNFTEAILEEKIEFSCEISFMSWRDKFGNVGNFPATLNEHKNGILCKSKSPANIPSKLIREGNYYANKIANKLKIFGILALETFIIEDRLILFNEIAPRPHNSFHWTIEGCNTSQFEQLVRIICEIAPRNIITNGDYFMQNILGSEINNIQNYLSNKNYSVHLYGKERVKPGRKMGHVTWRVNKK